MVNARKPYSCGDVVDQPRGADHRSGNQAGFPFEFLKWLQGGGIDERKIIDAGKSGLKQRVSSGFESSSDIAALADFRFRPLERLGKRDCPTPLVGRQISVAR